MTARKSAAAPEPVARARGRPALNPSGELMKIRQMRMTDDEWETCLALGGAAWIRAQIARAAKRC